MSNLNQFPKLKNPCHTYGVFALCLVVAGCLRPAPESHKGLVGSSPQITIVTSRVDETVEHVLRDRKLTQSVHAAWQVVHGVLAFGDSFLLETPRGTQSALQFLIGGGQLDGWHLAPGDQLPNGRVGLRAVLEPGTYKGQGHADQWLAVLAQADLPLDQRIQVQGNSFTMQDFLDQVQHDVPYNTEQEWSWTLIGITHYLPTSASWTAGDGETWDIERLVGNEVNQALEGSACGGTHRLIGLSMALNKRKAERETIDSVWRQSERLLMEATEIARQFQNGDGSFSTNYFQRPGISADSANLLATTGHTLEFLALTLSPEQLREPWVLRAVERLCDLLDDAQGMPLECGGLYHAVHGLVVFRDRALKSS